MSSSAAHRHERGDRGHLREIGVPEEHIHVERFVSALGGKPRPKKIVAPDAPPEAAHRMASLIVDGKRRTCRWPRARPSSMPRCAPGMDLPYACKGGMCSTCRAKVVEGEAQMEVNYSLEPWEPRPASS
jgi:ring-1,2-phenylacetyl-CoA epoxidase subunit PaaE